MKGKAGRTVQNDVEPCCSKNKLTLCAWQSSIGGGGGSVFCVSPLPI